MQSNIPDSSYATFPSSYEYPEELSQGSSALSSSESLSPQASTDSASVDRALVSVKRPEKRVIRSHRKTRQGCYNCKRRKIKCSEERPFCLPCGRNGLRCVYPATREASGVLFPQQLAVPQAQSMRELHSGRLEYTALDMRLLHHFIVEAYPHLPLNCDAVWKLEIPALAHQFNYLMHAMLAVSASNLVRAGEHSLIPAAHFHRLRAIEGVNAALDKPNRSTDEDDVLIGACYALAFQNSHLGESQISMWITVRSIAMIGSELERKKSTTRFQGGITPKAHATFMTERLKTLPLLRKELVFEALDATNAVEPICRDETEKEFHNLIRQTLNALLRSSIEAYFCHVTIYSFFATMDPVQFARFSEEKEDVLQILHCYFLAMQNMMAPILMEEWKHRLSPTEEEDEKKGHGEQKSSTRWSQTICTLPRGHPWQEYLRWPDSIQEREDADVLHRDCFEEVNELIMVDDPVDHLEAQMEHADQLEDETGLDPDTIVEAYEKKVHEYYYKQFCRSHTSAIGKAHVDALPASEHGEELAGSYACEAFCRVLRYEKCLNNC